ncbi:MAG: signal peptide peptidase SppA [Bacteroidota bacterium]
MKQFFKFLLASTLGTFIAIFIAGLVLFSIFAASIASFSKQAMVRSNSVLELNFDQLIPEQTNNVQVAPFEFDTDEVLGVHEVAKTIEHAAKDDKIKGIYLKSSAFGGGLVKVDIIREALENFKAEGKFIVSHSKFYTQSAYLLASSADQVYLNPMGMVDFRGFGGVLSFYKNLLEKTDIEMQIFWAGKFKGATEPYRLDKLSDANREQLTENVNDMYDQYLKNLSESRNISVDSLRSIADNYYGGVAEQAKAVGLIDEIAYEDQVMADLRERLGLGENKKVKTISLSKYHGASDISNNQSSDNVVAVVYAEGAILDGEGENGIIGDKPYMEVANKLRKDDKVKAVVLRVNSPGGSAMASENIWRTFMLLRDAGKPVIISMGEYAASGGYYIAAAGEYIFAEENTLTGSIGVYRMIPSLEKMYENKLGITNDVISTGPFATGFNPAKSLNETQKRWMQADTKRTYGVFLKRVADARNMTVEEVDEIAQGRVWTAKRAKANGLVDEIGDLDDAIAYAVESAELEDYRIKTYPKLKAPFEQMIEDIFNTDQAREKAIKAELGDFYDHYQMLKSMHNQKGVQAMMPFRLKID